MIQLIVGLGNPGEKYDKTRHNIGFDLVDILAKNWQINLRENRKYQGIFGEGISNINDSIKLLKPQTYMNLSGQSVRSVIDWYKMPPESVLVVYDDMDLPLGKLRLRLSGSAGGHNGMKSIISHLGTDKFPRLRLGIGKNKLIQEDTISHVLGKFTPQEKPIVHEILELSAKVVEKSLDQGLEKAMSIYNNKTIEPTKVTTE